MLEGASSCKKKGKKRGGSTPDTVRTTLKFHEPSELKAQEIAGISRVVGRCPLSYGKIGVSELTP